MATNLETDGGRSPGIASGESLRAYTDWLASSSLLALGCTFMFDFGSTVTGPADRADTAETRLAELGSYSKVWSDEFVRSYTQSRVGESR